MIEAIQQKQDWQKRLSRRVTSLEELCNILKLNMSELKAVYALVEHFPLRVPREFVAKMQLGDMHDPLLKQVLPIKAELDVAPGYTTDPLQEKVSSKVPGILHKYQGRVLLMIHGSCAVHCRYCFRRHFPYADQAATLKWQPALAYIQQDSSIEEVILSGGDPLMLKDDTFFSLINDLAAVAHVKRLRIHSRIPIVLPQRVTDKLVNILTYSRLSVIMVVHCNHPQEIAADVITAVDRLKRVGVTVLNQSVLLRGVNDQASVLIALSQKLFAAGVMPYYLHVLDKVAGSAHFDVPSETVQVIMRQVMRELPGYLVPKCVREVAGQPAKVPVNIVLNNE